MVSSSLIWANNKKSTTPNFVPDDDQEEGLRILVTRFSSLNPCSSSNIIKPSFSLNHIIDSINSNHTSSSTDCFLKSCHLCHKQLALDKEVYMYRGDLGFCSVGCRERQMYMDEMEELEISTRKVLASLQRRRRDIGRCEGSKDFRQPFSDQTNRVIFSHT